MDTQKKNKEEETQIISLVGPADFNTVQPGFFSPSWRGLIEHDTRRSVTLTLYRSVSAPVPAPNSRKMSGQIPPVSSLTLTREHVEWVTGNSVMTMIRKAEDTVLAGQADRNPAINKGTITSTVKKNTIFQHHILITESSRRLLCASPNDVSGLLTMSRKWSRHAYSYVQRNMHTLLILTLWRNGW